MSNKGTRSTGHKRRNKYAAPVGFAFALLAVVGLISIISISINLTQKLFDKSSEMEKFEQYIMPVLMFDPVPFDKVEDADENMILQASIWGCLLSEKRDTYTYDDGGMLLLPQSDVDVIAARLFGNSIKLEHRTFGDFEMTYYYNEEAKIYQVPIMVQTGFYRPDVTEISKKGDVVTLRVGYIPPSNAWGTDLTGKTTTPTPDKYMMYVLEEVKNGYKITGITEPPENEGQDGKGFNPPAK